MLVAASAGAFVVDPLCWQRRFGCPSFVGVKQSNRQGPIAPKARTGNDPIEIIRPSMITNFFCRCSWWKSSNGRIGKCSPPSKDPRYAIHFPSRDTAIDDQWDTSRVRADKPPPPTNIAIMTGRSVICASSNQRLSYRTCLLQIGTDVVDRWRCTGRDPVQVSTCREGAAIKHVKHVLVRNCISAPLPPPPPV